MVRTLIIALGMLMVIPGIAQEESSRFVHQGLIRTQATISLGMMRDDARNMYLHGDLEYFMHENVTVRSDAYFYLGATSDYEPLKLNHSLFVGAMYHFPTNNRFDPYVGVQPGIAYAQRILPYTDVQGNTLYSNTTFNPLISGTVGANYYGSKWFHVFVNARMVRGKLLSDVAPKHLDEFRISFGLGFNFN